MSESKSEKFPLNFTHWFQKHYMLVINGLLFIFLVFTMAAPIAMKNGWELTGFSLYRFYKRFCHQFAFRSWFLFGQQPYYPRIAGGDLFSYEEMFGVSPDDLMMASSILGNAMAGYKIAICQRDFAMYTAMLICGLIFVITKRKMKRIPLWLWIIIGVIPLGLDGITQLSGTGWGFLNWIPVRESTPLIRTVTGGLFGFMSGWYIYPSLESSLSNMQFNQAIKDVEKQL